MASSYLTTSRDIPDRHRLVQRSRPSHPEWRRHDAPERGDRKHGRGRAQPAVHGHAGGQEFSKYLSDGAETGNTSTVIIKKVNGPLPINSRHAGTVYPLEKLPAELQDNYANNVKFNKNGCSDFLPYARKSINIDGINDDYSHDARAC